ncbi:MAG: MFS transporter [Gammaproteobacteria bacterium]|nr:MFS transporter [Gammaproteobacteria bacterium]
MIKLPLKRPAVLFWIAILALTSAAISLSLRVAVSDEISVELFNPIDPANSVTLMTQALGVSFLGFAITLFLGSLALDFIGIRRMLSFSGIAFTAGALLVIFSDSLAEGETVYRIVWLGMALQGLGWGAVEAAINPLAATIYPQDTTHRINVLHAWWPAGLVIGGLWALAAGRMALDWRVILSVLMLPAMATTCLSLVSEFPQTQRVQSGVSFRDMVYEIIRRPSFFIWFGAMFLTAASELAPGQLVELILTQTVGMQGIIILVYVSGMMFVFRHFAGPLSRYLSPVGLLWCSSLLAAIGLFLLSTASSPAAAITAATFWGAGVCFMWPTMLAQAAERYPRGGPWTIGLIGTAGALSIHFVLPQFGAVYDKARVNAAGGEPALAELSGSQLDQVARIAAEETFQTIAILPLVLLIIFGIVFIYERFRNKI